jgi:hypothetical protein
MSKNTLAICELFHPLLHGQNETSSLGIANHFLIYTTIELAEFYDNSYKREEKRVYRNRMKETQLLELDTKHPSLRSYNQKYIRLEIIQADVLNPGTEHVAYLKTFWLRIVQRCWKRVFKARKELMLKRSNIKAIQERQRTGQWSKELREYPLFRLNLLN